MAIILRIVLHMHKWYIAVALPNQDVQPLVNRVQCHTRYLLITIFLVQYYVFANSPQKSLKKISMFPSNRVNL